MNAFRTMIITAADAPLARQIAETLAPTGGAGMWTTGLSSDGSEPATHYVSTGIIDEQFAALMPEQFWSQDENGDWVMTDSIPGDPVMLFNLCVQAGMTITQQEVDDIFASSDVTAQEPFVAMGRMGLVIITGDIDA